MFNVFFNYISSITETSEIKKYGENVLSFKYNDLSFVFATETSDPYYIRLMLPNVANVNDVKDVDKLINIYNNKYKVIKVSIIDDNIWLSAEQFLYSQENASGLFERMINILENVIKDFRKEINQ